MHLPTINFALLLFGLLVATGTIWVADVAILRHRRRAGAEATLRDFDRRATRADAPAIELERERLRERLTRRPGWVELPAGFFPVLLAVFLLRSFAFEPFRIPSGSMIPTLRIGDLILVNKFAYGLRVPIVDRELIALGSPQRGDVVVFRYPIDPSENYIKRLVGLPGDTIVYRDQHLTLNGQPVPTAAAPDFFEPAQASWSRRRIEELPRSGGKVVHDILVDDRRRAVIDPVAFPHRENCTFSDGNTAVTCKVPAGEYFVMGDNRDNSADSRYWGFVPDRNLVGKAVFIWMNFSDPGRIGPFR